MEGADEMKKRMLAILQCLEVAFLATVVAGVVAVFAKKREIAELGVLLSTLTAVVVGMMRPRRSCSSVCRWQRGATLFLSPFAVLQLVLFFGWVWIGTPIAGWRQLAKFRELVKEADRVEVHDMRMLFKDDSDGKDLCCVLTDKDEIAAFVKLLGFARKAPPCGCKGNPSIEWWKGDECIARLSIHHYGYRVSIWGCGATVDRGLTFQSRLELNRWFERRCGVKLE